MGSGFGGEDFQTSYSAVYGPAPGGHVLRYARVI